jgi:hypothetical protein
MFPSSMRSWSGKPPHQFLGDVYHKAQIGLDHLPGGPRLPCYSSGELFFFLMEKGILLMQPNKPYRIG